MLLWTETYVLLFNIWMLAQLIVPCVLIIAVLAFSLNKEASF